jgi:hypothetical protein
MSFHLARVIPRNANRFITSNIERGQDTLHELDCEDDKRDVDRVHYTDSIE